VGNTYDVRYFGEKHVRGLVDSNDIRPFDTPLTDLQVRKTASWVGAYDEMQKYLALQQDRSLIEKLPEEVQTGESKRTRKKAEPEYEVEGILAQRVVGATTEYKVKWKTATKPTWEPESNLTGCPDILADFMLQQNNTPKKRVTRHSGNQVRIDSATYEASCTTSSTFTF